MGSKCCSQGDQTAPSAKSNVKRTKKAREKGGEASSDSESNSDSDSYHNTYSLRSEADFDSDKDDDDKEHEIEMQAEEKTKVIAAFKQSVQQGNESLCAHFISEYPKIKFLDLRYQGNDTALHIATRNQHYRLMLYLISNGVSPNAQNHIGDTPLHVASKIRQEKCVAFLCRVEDTDVNITNNNDETALSIAVDHHDEDIIEMLSDDAQAIISSYSVKDRDRRLALDDSDEDSDIDMDDRAIGNTGHRVTERMYEDADDILDHNEDNNGSVDLTRKHTANIWEKGPHKIDRAATAPSVPSPQTSALPTLEEALDSDQQRQLQVIKIARTNPFSKLKRANTQKALQEMEKMSAQAVNLPKLNAWLEKKQASAPYWWQKRWVMVEESYFLWSDKMREIKNVRNPQERAKFSGNINLMMVNDVVAIDKKTKSHRKFMIQTKEGQGKPKEYIFRGTNRRDRDFWVEALKQHINHQKQMLSFLGTK